MHADNLKLLYNQYKTCIRNQFSEYLEDDDRYVSYFDKCQAQIQDIHNYYSPIFAKLHNTNPADEAFIDGEREKGVFILTKYGWDEKRSSNMYNILI